MDIILMSSFSDNGDGGMKALQDELKSLRQLLEHQQQQQKPVSFVPSSFQYPFWQPSQFPFSSPMHSGPTHENSVPPTHQGSAPPTHKDPATPNHKEFVPSTHEGSDEHSKGQPSESTSDHSSSSSHRSNHTNSVAASESSTAKIRPPTSKVAMETTAQQQHTEPALDNNNDESNKSISKPHSKQRTNNKMPSHKDGKQHKKIPSLSPEVLQSDQSDSSVSLLTSSNGSTLSVFDSPKLTPNQLSGFQRDNPVATETVRVPSNANLSTWVCPLCGGRSVIVNSSGTRQHHHRQPKQAKTPSRSTQNDRGSHWNSSRSTRHPHRKKIFSAENDFSKSRHIPTLRNSGLDYNNDVPDGPSNRSSGLHYNSDVPDGPSNRSGGLHYNSDVPGNRSSGLHRNNNVFSNRSSGLHHGYTPPVQGSSLHYSSDTPGPRSSGLHYRNKAPGIRSSVLHYNSDVPVSRSIGTQYNRINRSYRKPKRSNLYIPTSDTVTFTHPKATSTPVVVHSTQTQTHDYSSDSSDIPTPPVTHQPTNYIVLESSPCRRRYHVRSHVPRCHHSYRYLTTSSDDDEPYYR